MKCESVFPQRAGRVVLDGVVDPEEVNNILPYLVSPLIAYQLHRGLVDIKWIRRDLENAETGLQSKELHLDVT